MLMPYSAVDSHRAVLWESNNMQVSNANANALHYSDSISIQDYANSKSVDLWPLSADAKLLQLKAINLNCYLLSYYAKSFITIPAISVVSHAC